MEKKAFQFDEKVRQAYKIIINETDQVVTFSNEKTKVEVLRLVANGYVAGDLRQLKAQAFDGKSFDERNR